VALGRLLVGPASGTARVSDRPLTPECRWREAAPSDVTALDDIYGHAVRTSTATFDVTPPPADYWLTRIQSKEPGDHVLVACDGDARVIGFAYSGAFRPRPAYGLTRETSIYLAPDATGRGIGRALYAVLLDLLRADGMHLAVAVVACPNPASHALHRSVGFQEVGTLREVGRKFDQWVDTTWYQLPLEAARAEESPLSPTLRSISEIGS